MEAPATGVKPSPRMSRGEWGLAVALFAMAFAAVLVTTNDYGPTYDEPHYASAGAAYAEWWALAARAPSQALNRSAIEAAWGLNHEHPPLQKVAAGFSTRWLGNVFVGLMATRLPSALWFALAVSAVYLFTRGIWGWRGGLFSALALATMPRVVAHAHFVALDMPIMAWFFVTVALAAEALRRDSWWWTLLAGVAFGFALLSKVNAFFIPVLLLPYALIWYRDRWLKAAAALAVLGPLVFLLCWPWMWVDPIPHVKGYLAFHFRHAAYNVWYLGKLYPYAPWHYPLVMTAVTTPALLLAAAGIGMGRSVPRRGIDPERALLLLGLVITLLPNALPGTPKYNGVRLFLPAFPFLAGLAGGGFDWLQSRVAGAAVLRRAGGKHLATLLVALLGGAALLPGVQGITRTHPYQLAYYNALVGGTAGATRRGFETIYWGQVMADGAGFVNAIEEESPKVLVIPKGVIYLFTLEGPRPDIRFTGDEGEASTADHVVFQCMQSDFTELCWELYRNAEPEFAVRLGETPLFVAYDRAAVGEALARIAERKPAAAASSASAASERKSPTRKLAGS